MLFLLLFVLAGFLMKTYVCYELVSIKNIYGSYDCKTWVESTNLLDVIAITPAQAAGITVAICTLLATGFVLGEIAGIVKKMG